LFFNNEQIELSLESRGVVNPTRNFPVTPISVHFFNILLNPDLLIKRNDNFFKFNKIWEVNNMLDEKIHYVYVYLNPLKPGKFIYLDCGLGIEFDYEPFYIGKGQRGRLLDHLKELGKIIKNKEIKFNNHKINIINKILKENKEPIIYKIIENLTDKQVCDIEKVFIRLIGRKDKKLGPLTNLTDGGDGTTGVIPWNKGKSGIQKSSKKGKTEIEMYGEEKAKELKEKRSKKRSEETKKKISDAMKNVIFSKERNDKISKSHLGKKQSKEWVNKRVKSREGYKHSEETKQKMKRSLTEETKKKISKANKGKISHKRGKTNIELYGEEKANEIKKKRRHNIEKNRKSIKR